MLNLDPFLSRIWRKKSLVDDTSIIQEEAPITV
jgi:hypothetical protein